MEESSKLLELLEPIDLRLGRALRICQIFEGSLRVLHMLIDEFERQAAPDTVRIDDSYSKKTLGQLINLLKQRIDVPRDAREYIYDAIEMRNEIVHEYWNRPELAEKLNSAEGRIGICDDLDSKNRAIRARDLLVNRLIDQYLARYGKSVQQLKDEATQRWAFLRGEE